MSELSPLTSCLPCLHGVHSRCRHWPEGPRFSRSQSEKGKSCQCEESGHEGEPGTCNHFISSDWGSSRCGKPAKGEAPNDWGMRADEVVEVCGIHLNAHRKRVERDERWEREWAEKRERWDREKAAAKASEDWAQKLRDEFNLPVEALKRNDEKVRVEMSPELAYDVLSEIRGLLNEVYGDHPWVRDG